MFYWKEVYKEIALKIVKYKNNHSELLLIIKKMESNGLKVISIKDQTPKNNVIKLNDIDPFTFFSSFNRGITNENRYKILVFLKEYLKLKSSFPDDRDFKAIPVMTNFKSWFFAYAYERNKNDINELWELFEKALNKSDINTIFNKVIIHKGIKSNITSGLYWIDPNNYLSLDDSTATFLKNNGIDIKYSNYDGWLRIMNDVKNKFPNKTFSEIMYNAWLDSHNNKEKHINKFFLNAIYYGPPGTGKTWCAKNISEKIVKEM